MIEQPKCVNIELNNHFIYEFIFTFMALPSHSTYYHTIFDAVQANNIFFIASYQAAGCDLNIRDENGLTPLLLASNCRKSDAVKQLLKYDINVNATDKHGNTALMSASFKGYEEIVLMLLMRGANINQQNSIGASALFFAATFEKTDVIKLLIQHQADTRTRDFYGMTASDYARNQENVLLATMLV